MDAVQYAERHGVKVNKDIVFVSYANLPITSYTAYPPLASLEQYPLKQGQKAMELMISLLSGRDPLQTAPVIYHREELSATLITHVL